MGSKKETIPKSIQLVAGRTAREYNIRKKRQGAFWEDRYHATAIEDGIHLLKCLVYIDMKEVVSSNRILQNKKQTLNVFPNPASDIVFLKSQYEIKNITVYNIVGIKVLDQRVEKLKETSLNIAVLKKGIYFIGSNEK